MAQERTGRRGRLARRYALSARAGVAVALVALLGLGAAAALTGTLAEAPVTVERADPEEEAAQDEGAPEGEEPAEAEPTEAAPTVVVHVDGAVAAPGVYELSGSPRADDAIRAAGGLLPEADTSGINLAAPISDGEKLHVPAEGEAPPAETPAQEGESSAAGEPGLVNINTAGIDELDRLPGIGEATARAIVEDREANGPFSTPEDLMRVTGIGEKKYAKLEAMICV